MEVIQLRKGLSIIETIVAVAILAIFMLLASPMVKNYSMVYDRVTLQNRIDYEYGKVLEIMKRKIRSARLIDDGELAEVANAIEVLEDYTTSEGVSVISELRLLVPNEDNDEYENYIAFRIIESDTDSDNNGYKDRSLVYVTNPNDFVSTESESITELIEYIDDTDYNKDTIDDEEYFEYREGVVLIYLDIDIDRMTGESIEGDRNILDKIRDSAVTRINIDMSKNY
jgi:prepilin-type N-terminal cleavage/methylation domain-containing protein